MSISRPSPLVWGSTPGRSRILRSLGTSGAKRCQLTVLPSWTSIPTPICRPFRRTRRGTNSKLPPPRYLAATKTAPALSRWASKPKRRNSCRTRKASSSAFRRMLGHRIGKLKKVRTGKRGEHARDQAGESGRVDEADGESGCHPHVETERAGQHLSHAVPQLASVPGFFVDLRDSAGAGV